MYAVLKFLFDASSADWIRFACFFAGIFLFIGIAEKTRSALGWSPEVNRKLVHIMTGVLIFFAPLFFVSNRPLVWMAVIFIAVNYLGVTTGKLKGMHDTQRRSYGTVYYPLTFLILVLVFWNGQKSVLILSILILALADAAAAIVGENLKHPHEYYLGNDKKSREGSLVMFLTSFFIVFILLPLVGFLDGHAVNWVTSAWIGLAAALVATALEALSIGGSDNLSAPLGAAFVLHFMLTHSVQANEQFTIGLGVALGVAVLSYRIRILTASGSVGTFLLATLIFGTGGWIWSLPILIFFVLSSVLSRVGRVHKAQFAPLFEKSSCRDIGQVLANGAAAGLVMLVYNFFPRPIFYWLFLGALAAVNADTWATEIGVFSKISPRLITTFQKVTPGTSGGITLLGTLSALLGSLAIALSGWIASPVHFHISLYGWSFWIVVAGGFLASLVDSLLGATLQAQYRCPVCNKITERKIHCQNRKTQFLSGKAWLHNDGVNFLCSLSGIVFVWIGRMIFSK